jgi:hypothetical protein
MPKWQGPSSGNVNEVWECLSDTGWVPYQENIASIVESAFQRNLSQHASAVPPPASIKISLGIAQYKIDFKSMTQVNVLTHKVRNVQRVNPRHMDARSLNNNVLWACRTDQGWVNFDSNVSAILEQAYVAYMNHSSATKTKPYLRKIPPVKFSMNGMRYEIDLESMTQTNMSTRKSRRVRRTLRPCSALAASLFLEAACKPVLPVPIGRSSTVAQQRRPIPWGKGGPASRLVEVAQASPEWHSVVTEFKQTATSFRVLQVQRVENSALWETYETGRILMAERRGGAGANEMRLFHGTSAEAAAKIAVQGFNRSFVTTHLYGRGTYFARDASYAASDAYSQPDAAGKKRAFLARVLVGDACAGTRNDLVPPQPRPGGDGPLDTCDTTVDNPLRPTIFVTYKDQQQYPAYLITFVPVSPSLKPEPVQCPQQ